MKSIFIMSSERSGSNLLRRMLGANSAVSAPPPPHMWRHLSPNLFKYGSLDNAANLSHLISDAISMTQIAESHLYWNCSISLDDVLGKLNVKNLTGIIAAIYETYAYKQGATSWVCKENNLFDYAFQIRTILPSSKFIYLCRDGRDVACSMQKVPSHDQHIWFIAEEWAEEQKRCLLVYQELLAHDASIIVRYEDLISNPETKLRHICDFLELDYESRMIEFHKSKESKDEASKTKYWENLVQPVMKNNKAKFLRELSSREINLFETAAGEVLKVLGYPLLGTGTDLKIRRVTLFYYFILNKVQTFFQKRKLLEEVGRLERQIMLENIYNRRVDIKKSFMSPISYQ